MKPSALHLLILITSIVTKVLITMANKIVSAFIAIALLVVHTPTGVDGIGVCYGLLGDDLPPPREVVELYKANHIDSMRLYEPNQAVLEALRGSGISVFVGIPNEDLQRLAGNPTAAAEWVRCNVLAYWPDVSFRYIAAGNELIPEHEDVALYVLPAMESIHAALSAADLQDQIKVSTSVSMQALGSSYPPSEGAFSPAAGTYLNPIVRFLARTGSPLLLNVYPYFAYQGCAGDVSLPYALLASQDTAMQDGELVYQNLFDAMVDAAYAALEKADGGSVRIVVSESGWPSGGASAAASVENARMYNQNLIAHIAKGTPRRGGDPMEVYLFAMFNENQKGPAEEEKHFGLFYSSKLPVYPINFVV